jgi:predicted acetyltransferase
MPDYGPPSGNKELRTYAEILAQSFAGKVEDMLEWLTQLPERELRVWRGQGRVIGGLTAYRIGQFFGGQSVPMCGVAGVVVTPHARKSGAGSGAMRALLDELHDEGTALSTLYPATQPVYRKLGYEVAGAHINYALPIGSITVREHGAEIRPAEQADEMVMASLYTARALATNGNLDRTAFFWLRKWGKGENAAYRYIIEENGKPTGYVIYRAQRVVFPKQDLVVADFSVKTPQAARRLLSYFAEHRSVGERVTLFGAPIEPLFFHLAEQKHKIEARWDWMTRIVCLKPALEKRGYAQHVKASLELEVRDDVLAENSGRWKFEVEGGKASVEKGGKGKVKIDIRGLAALYTGALSAQDARLAGYLECSAAESDTLNAIFAGPTPWTPDFF